MKIKLFETFYTESKIIIDAQLLTACKWHCHYLDLNFIKLEKLYIFILLGFAVRATPSTRRPLPPILMKTLLIAILLILNLENCFCQNQSLIGNYKSFDSYIHIISNDSLEFMSTIVGGFITTIFGCGRYVVENDKILLKAVRPNTTNFSSFLIKDSIESRRIEILILDNSNPIMGCNAIIGYKNKRKVLLGNVADKNGKLIFDNLAAVSVEKAFLKLSLIGYDSFEIPLKDVIGKSIEVNLSPFIILDNKNISFQIVQSDMDYQIIGPYFEKVWTKKWNNKGNKTSEAKIFKKQ